MTDNPYRLPRTATPVHYDLRLEPDLDSATFTGTAHIRVQVHEPTAEIVVNAAELAIDTATVSGPDGTLSCTVELDEAHERATLGCGATLEPGSYDLVTDFRGVLNDKLRGFYRSTFTDADGTERVIATTQFESTNARRAFPCWDEPDLKATFEITLVVPDDLLAVSCAAEVGATPLADGRREVRFAPTMVMSTYLVAFIVGPLEATAPRMVGDTPIRVIHPAGKGHLTDFALDAGTFALAHFEDYFAIPYPGDKLDLVAIPDFAFGAMENLGAVTFREILLLIDPERSTRAEQRNAADVIAHELAHMWFGDLVTMKWWEGIWLKEAFATFCEMHCTDAWRPDWQRWVDFGLSRSEAFDVDALAETRAIEYPVVSPADAEGMYDLLTYEKGAAVVRMLEQFLEPDTFRDGVRRYLADHAYGATETTDLWDALEAASGQPVRRVMDGWIFQGGHPLVTVRHLDADTVELSQRRFRYDGTDDGERWGVPVVMKVFRGDDVDTIRALLEDERHSVTVGPHDAVLVNADASGFYRVTYQAEAAAALATLAPGRISAIERYGLVDDAWAATVSGALDVGDYLRLLEGFAAEDDLSVWSLILATLGTVDHLIDAEDRPAFAGWVDALISPLYGRLGPTVAEDDDDRTRSLRGAALGALGTLAQRDDVIDRARALLDDDEADPSLRAAAVGVVASLATTDDFDELVSRFHNADTPQDERRFSFALAAVPGAAEFRKLLTMCTDGTIRSQDAPYLLGRALGNRDHGATAWRHITDNWDHINASFPPNSIVRMLTGIRELSTPDLAADVEGFCAAHPVEQGERTLAQHLERLRVNVGLRRRVADQAPAVFA